VIGIGIEGLVVSYDSVPALGGVSLEVSGGGWLGLIGPNGAGKSTLLRALSGLVSYSGRACLGEEEVSSVARRKLAQLVAFVPQRPLVPRSMSVADYVLMGRTPYIPYLGTEGREDIAIVSDVLDRLELGDLATRSLGSLSGGELQRCVLGRALAQQAPVLLLDEPTAALDVGHQQQVLELVDALRVDHSLTIVSAMHDLTLAGQFAETLVLLSSGKAVASGSARTVLTEPTIRAHYGASVRVLEGPDGDVLVIPRRTRTTLDDREALER
jgi:iron complex transport system ATP-binding protein